MNIYKKSSDTPKANCLFLPGIPGKVKDFAFFEDLVKENVNIYFHRYPGAYGQEGELSFKSVNDSIYESVKELDETGIPLIIVAYSFSTYFMWNFKYEEFKNIISVSFFSPIIGLDLKSIKEDFVDTLTRLKECGEVTSDPSEWQQELLALPQINILNELPRLDELDIPFTLGFSLNDKLINVEKIDTDIEKYRQEKGYGKFLVFRQTEGYHKLDSYYNKYIAHYFSALIIMEDLNEILGKDIGVYYWGSSQAYNLFRGDSDIDLLVFGDKHLEKYKELNIYVLNYQDSHNSKFDLSINDKSDLMSHKIFRFNRGPVIIHGVHYLYFAFKRVKETIRPSWNEVVKDCYRLNLINLLEARKILCKTSVKSERVKKIIKFYVMSLVYLLYTRGDKNIDINRLLEYFENEKKYYDTLKKAIDLFKNDFNGLDIEFLYECVLSLTDVVSEQEQLLKIDNNSYEYSI